MHRQKDENSLSCIGSHASGILCTLQVGIGIFTKSTAEYAKRGEDFSKVRLSKQPSTVSLQAMQGALQLGSAN